MMHFKHEKYITLTIVTGFVAEFFTYGSSGIFYPPDYSGTIPVYAPESNVIICIGIALFICACTVMGVKLSDEKKVLPAAGFTMLAITSGIWLAALFEITQSGSAEDFEKSYYIITCSNFLYLPAMLLIAMNDDFKKWVRYVGIGSFIPFLISSVMFVSGYRNFTLLDEISSSGYALVMLAQVMWAVNVYGDYRKKIKSVE